MSEVAPHVDNSGVAQSPTTNVSAYCVSVNMWDSDTHVGSLGQLDMNVPTSVRMYDIYVPQPPFLLFPLKVILSLVFTSRTAVSTNSMHPAHLPSSPRPA